MKRLLSLLLIIALIVTMIPGTVFANERGSHEYSCDSSIFNDTDENDLKTVNDFPINDENNTTYAIFLKNFKHNNTDLTETDLPIDTTVEKLEFISVETETFNQVLHSVDVNKIDNKLWVPKSEEGQTKEFNGIVRVINYTSPFTQADKGKYFRFRLTLSDNKVFLSNQTYSVVDNNSGNNQHVVNNNPVITTESLPEGILGQLYEAQLQATPAEENGTITWSTTSNMPQGITLSNDGKIYGTPTMTGTYSIQFCAAEGEKKVYRSFIIEIGYDPNITVTAGNFEADIKVNIGTATIKMEWPMYMSVDMDNYANANVKIYYVGEDGTDKEQDCIMYPHYTDRKRLMSSEIYIYGFRELQKITATGYIMGKTVSAEKTADEINNNGKITFNFGENGADIDGTLYLERDNRVVNTIAFKKGDKEKTISLISGEYTVTAKTYIPGGIGEVALMDAGDFSINTGMAINRDITLESPSLIKPVINPTGITNGYYINWYKGDNLVASGSSYYKLRTDTDLKAEAVPFGELSAEYYASDKTLVSNDNITLTLKKKDTFAVSGKLYCKDKDGKSVTGSGYVVLIQPGVAGAVKTTSKFFSGKYSFEGVTAGSTITFSPGRDFWCNSETVTVSAASSDNDITAERINNIVELPPYMAGPEGTLRTMLSSYKLTVKKNNEDINFRVLSDNAIALDDETSENDEITITGYQGDEEYPTRTIIAEGIIKTANNINYATANCTYTHGGLIELKGVKDNNTQYNILLYKNGSLIQSKTLNVGYENFSYRSPYLPEGQYTVVIAHASYIRRVDFQSINNVKTTCYKKEITITGTANYKEDAGKLGKNSDTYSDVNRKVSYIDVTQKYTDALAFDINIALKSDHKIDLGKKISLTVLSGQGGASIKSISINGIPVTAYCSGSKFEVYIEPGELKAYGGFPLRINAIVSQDNFDKLYANAILKFTDKKGDPGQELVCETTQNFSNIRFYAPDTVSDKTFWIYGYAPKKNMEISVMLDGIEVAKTKSGYRFDGKATTTPIYIAKVELPETAKESSVYSMQVSYEKPDKEGEFITSVPLEILYSQSNGSLKKIEQCLSYYYGENDVRRYTIWDKGNPESEGLSYFADAMKTWWEIEFNNPDKVKDVYIHIPKGDGTETVMKAERISGTGKFKTEEKGRFSLYGSSPNGLYVSFEAATPVTVTMDEKTSDVISAEKFNEASALLNESGIITGMTGTEDNFSFKLKNDKGEDINITTEYKELTWDNSEIEGIVKEEGDMPFPDYEPNLVYYHEGYLDINDDGKGCWGVEEIRKYQVTDNPGNVIYQRTILTAGERTVVTWDVDKKKKTVLTMKLGNGGTKISGTESRKYSEKVSHLSAHEDKIIEYWRTVEIYEIWDKVFTRIGNAAITALNTDEGNRDKSKKAMSRGINIETISENAQELAADSETWADGADLTIDEITALFQAIPPEAVAAYKMHESAGGENPYAVVGVIRGLYYEKCMSMIEKIIAFVTGVAYAAPKKEVVKTIFEKFKDGVKDKAVNGLKGKVFYRKSNVLAGDLRNVLIRLNREERGPGGLAPGGVSLDNFPNELLYNDVLGESSTAGMNTRSMALPKSPQGKFDPSGYIYEAVPSNRVQGAKIELFTYDEGNMVFVDSDLYNIEPNPQITGIDGKYKWFVPEGYWRVIASKDGYEIVDTGSSDQYGVGATKALKINGTTVNVDKYWMPVLPEQLDVNISIRSTEPPRVLKVNAAEDGVYITFSKYMQNNLDKSSFKINDSTPAEIEPVNSEKSSKADDAPLYASVFKLTYPDSGDYTVGKKVKVSVSKEVTSYADAKMITDYTEANIVIRASLEKAEMPAASPQGGRVEENTSIVLTSGTAGADIYYTLNGIEPSAESLKFTGEIIIDRKMTIKAVAIKAGYAPSDIMTETYTIADGNNAIPNNQIVPGGIPAPEPKPELPVINAGTVGGKTVLSEDGTTLTIIPDEGYEIKSVTVNGEDKGKVTTITGLKTGDIVAVEFVLTQKEPDKTSDEKAKGIIKKLKLDNSSKYTSKKNIKITCKVDVSELKKLGYKVKYKFYRSTKKSSGYKLKITKTANTYINTKGKKGTKYYYKTKLAIYDKEVKLVETTAFKQSDVAYRTWKKK